MHAEQIVQPTAGQELAAHPERAGRLRVARDQVPGHDVVGRHRGIRGFGGGAGLVGRVGGVGEHRGERPLITGVPDHRRGVPLTVQLQALVVDAAIEVDGQLRNARHRTRPGQMHATIAGDHPAGELDLAIRPCAEQRTPVNLHRHLGIPRRTRIRIRLDPETRRIRVGTDDAERRTLGRVPPDGVLRHHPCHGRSSAHQHIRTRRRRPRAGLVHQRRTGGDQPARHLRRRVIRTRRSQDEIHQIRHMILRRLPRRMR